MVVNLQWAFEGESGPIGRWEDYESSFTTLREHYVINELINDCPRGILHVECETDQAYGIWEVESVHIDRFTKQEYQEKR